MHLVKWTLHNKNLWFQWLENETILRFNYKSIPVFAIKQSNFSDFLKIILSQNSELEIILSTFDMITFNDWLNQSEIVITEKHRTGIRRKDNILYTCFRLDKFEEYIKNISFSSFETDDIEQYNEKHDSQIISNEYSNNHNINEISNNWSDYDEESESENEKYEDIINHNHNIISNTHNEMKEELKTGDIIFEQRTELEPNIFQDHTKLDGTEPNIFEEYTDPNAFEQQTEHTEPNILDQPTELKNNSFVNYDNDDIPVIYTEDIIMKDKTPEINDEEKDTLNTLKQMYDNIKKMQQELKENNQTICERRNKTTIKRNNNRLIKDIIDEIQLIQQTSYPFYEKIIKENKWIQKGYKYYQNNNKTINTELINIIVEFEIMLQDLNININKQNYKQKIKKNNRKRKRETKLYNEQIKKRKKQADY